METYQNLKKGTRAGLLISLILNLLGIAVCIFIFATDFCGKSIGNQIHTCTVFVMYISIAFYALFGYKKPHGNMLKYLMLAFSLFIMIKFFLPAKPNAGTVEDITKICDGLSVILVAYMGGRLNRIDKNKALIVIAGVLICVGNMLITFTNPSMYHLGIIPFIMALSYPVCWVALCFAYTARFEQHKAAGLEE